MEEPEGSLDALLPVDVHPCSGAQEMLSHDEESLSADIIVKDKEISVCSTLVMEMP